ncbi:MAG: metallophosphoesterase [Clostridia bacterium]|nr:metallophosphoesterase [Clostridia bacterium]
MKRQIFSRPDRYCAFTGDLRHWTVSMDITGAPGFMRNIRAVFISDLHVTNRTTSEHMQKLADSINSLRPDILLMGGDYADKQEDAIRFYKSLRSVKAPLGKYAAIGNNDGEDWEGYEQVRKAMGENGIELLVNESKSIPVDGGTICVAGVDEPKHGAPDYAGLYPEAPTEGVYRILLSHFPQVPRVLPDLMLSGHTHGGQFNAFGITPFTIGFERIMDNEEFSDAIAGLHDMDGAKLLVSKGVGASRLQLRIGVRPEIYDLRFEC